jgi:hypothetical protein
VGRIGQGPVEVRECIFSYYVIALNDTLRDGATGPVPRTLPARASASPPCRAGDGRLRLLPYPRPHLPRPLGVSGGDNPRGVSHSSYRVTIDTPALWDGLPRPAGPAALPELPPRHRTRSPVCARHTGQHRDSPTHHPSPTPARHRCGGEGDAPTTTQRAQTEGAVRAAPPDVGRGGGDNTAAHGLRSR